MFELIHGDARIVLQNIEQNSVNTVITSPPYYGLRDYGISKWIGGNQSCQHIPVRIKINNTANEEKNEKDHPIRNDINKAVCQLCGAIMVDDQIGMEETPEQYIDNLVTVFRECWRVLRDDGVLWVNIGDSYNGSGGNHKARHKNDTGFQGRGGELRGGRGNHLKNLKPKDLIGIPWALAFALRDDGWYLRQDVIWAKNNPMPEAVKDRCTRSHEYIFMLTKNKNYYFNHEAIQEESVKGDGSKRNKRDVWNVCTAQSNKYAHHAVFPKDLIRPCILSSCPDGGTILDPFNGSGTTGILASNYGMNYIGVELNDDYINITKKRVEEECSNVSIVVRNQ